MNCPHCGTHIGHLPSRRVRVEEGLDRFDVVVFYCQSCNKILGIVGHPDAYYHESFECQAQACEAKKYAHDG